jgi:hypothetical protein
MLLDDVVVANNRSEPENLLKANEFLVILLCDDMKQRRPIDVDDERVNDRMKLIVLDF